MQLVLSVNAGMAGLDRAGHLRGMLASVPLRPNLLPRTVVHARWYRYACTPLRYIYFIADHHMKQKNDTLNLNPQILRLRPHANRTSSERRVETNSVFNIDHINLNFVNCGR